MRKRIGALLLLCAVCVLAGSVCHADDGVFEYKVAIVGHPSCPQTSYDEYKLARLKELGFNMVQLNLAWGKRPADEALNLEDILSEDGLGGEARVSERLRDIKYRAELAKKNGFRTMFHFGAPRIENLYRQWGRIDEATGENSVLREEIVEKYVRLLTRLKEEVPEVDDILVYTFDQDAWMGNEFGTGAPDRGIPLNERVTPFLRILTETWSGLNPDGRLWWEPWEISAGQIYACFPDLPVRNFGFALHSNIAEVQLTRPVDVWFRNMLNLANERGIPVMGEIFMGSANEELEPLEYVSAPRLVGEEIDALAGLPGISGVKEYYGLRPDIYDPNMLMAGLKLNNPGITNAEALEELARPYGKSSQRIADAWEATAMGLSLFPWDATWNFRRLVTRAITPYHTWTEARLNGRVASSPSWESTRKSLFMTTENKEQHPWFFEDIELRCKAAAGKLSEAISLYEQLDNEIAGGKYGDYVRSSLRDLRILEQTMFAIYCYCREANLTWLMRKYLNEGVTIPEDIVRRFEDVMQQDIVNQEKGWTENSANEPTAREMLRLFKADPVAWAEKYYIYR